MGYSTKSKLVHNFSRYRKTMELNIQYIALSGKMSWDGFGILSIIIYLLIVECREPSLGKGRL